MTFTVVAKMSAGLNATSNFRKNLQDRRAILEQARSARVRRIRADFEKIAKREAEFSRSLVHDLVPFRLVWNEAAVQKIKEYAPFSIEEKKDIGSASHDDTSDHLVEKEL